MHALIRGVAAVAVAAPFVLGVAQPVFAADGGAASAADPVEIVHVTPTWPVPAWKTEPVRPEAQSCPPSHPWLVGAKKEFAPSRNMPLGTEAITDAWFLQLRVDSLVQGAGDGKAGGIGSIRLFNDGVFDITVHFRLHCTNDPGRTY